LPRSANDDGEYETVEISNLFSYGQIFSIVDSQYHSIIGGAGSEFTDTDIIYMYSNVYYLEGMGGRLFAAGDVNGANGMGTKLVKTVIHGKTEAEFATAAMADLLNNGRRGANAPWEYIEGSDYPTLKPLASWGVIDRTLLSAAIEQAAQFTELNYGANAENWAAFTAARAAARAVAEDESAGQDDIDAAETALTAALAKLLNIDVVATYGGVITIGADGTYTVTPTAEDYVIDAIWIDGAPLDGVQALTSYTTAAGQPPARSIVASFAYTLNFQQPENGTLSVLRLGETLTSGSIVRAGEILTITAAASSGYRLDHLTLDGLTRVGNTDAYTVTALRGSPPGVTAAFRVSSYYAPPVINTGTDGKQTQTDTGAASEPAEAQPLAPSVVSTETVTAAAAVDAETGRAAAVIQTETVKTAVAKAVKAVEAAKADGVAAAAAAVRIVARAENADGVTSSEVSIPYDAVKAAADAKDIILTVESDRSTVTLDTAAVAAIAADAKAGETVKITSETVDSAEALHERQREKVGDSPVIALTITAGGTAITNLGGSGTVSVPYTPKAETAKEDYDLLAVYRLDDDGDITETRGAVYDAETGRITFATNRFGKFFISEWINPFGDIAKGAWYYKAARYAYSNGLITGVTETTFAPQTNLTRAMLVTMLYRLNGDTNSQFTLHNSQFGDVEDGVWYTDAITWAAAHGIVNGVGDNKFAPDDDITREQLAAILYRYEQIRNPSAAENPPAASIPAAYTDANEISDWAYDAMAWAVSGGLITGRAETTLAPRGETTRAEAATLLMRYPEGAG
jgi:hypothetical protein